MRTAIYARISKAKDGSVIGVERQERACRELAEREGWPVDEVYVDNDLSAHNGAKRPGYERLLADLDAGDVGRVLVWHTDRLVRRVKDLEDVINVVERSGAEIRTVTAGDIDLTGPTGRMVARLVTTVADYEVDHLRERTRAGMADLAERGLPNGGGLRPYGYERGLAAVVPEEAERIREAVKRILAGEALRAIARDWNIRGVPTVKGGKWSYQSLKRLVLAPRLAALRAHHTGDPACTNNPCLEVVGPGRWPAIITADEHRRVVTRLAPGSAPAAVRANLLTGLVHCGREGCAAKLLPRKEAGGARVYRCESEAREPGRSPSPPCGRLSVRAPRVDDEVRDRVVAVLAGAGLARALEALTGDDEAERAAREQLAADRGRLDELATDYADGGITRSEWRAARARLTGRITKAERRLAGGNSKAGVLAALPADPDALRARWDAAGLDWRRSVVEALIVRVRVEPRGRGAGRVFDGSRVKVDWRV